jgi:DNA-binding HxlR family transcriptional regulator
VESPQPSAQASSDPAFCPVGRSMDLIGERWTLVLVRHLLSGARGFAELRERTGIAPRVLSTRLKSMSDNGLVTTVQAGSRRHYTLTDLGRSLAPLVHEIARWWVLNKMAGTGPFRETSAVSVVESLPFLLNTERASGVRITYELRLTGEGAGVWTVEIDDGTCTVQEGFADRADVRYTADAQDWCLLAIGVTDDREAVLTGRLIKDGQGGSMAWYFYQPMASRQPRQGEV